MTSAGHDCWFHVTRWSEVSRQWYRLQSCHIRIMWSFKTQRLDKSVGALFETDSLLMHHHALVLYRCKLFWSYYSHVGGVGDKSKQVLFTLAGSALVCTSIWGGPSRDLKVEDNVLGMLEPFGLTSCSGTFAVEGSKLGGTHWFMT